MSMLSPLGPATCYILSNEKYEDTVLNTTNNADIEKLQNSLSRLNINPVIHREKKVAEIRQLMTELSNTDFESSSAILIVILTNGRVKGQVHASDDFYDLETEIFKPIINNPTLKNKPKIFIVEANRGFREIDNITVDAVAFGKRPSKIIKLFSNYEGYKSCRTSEHSLLIKSFCSVLDEFGASHDIKWIFQKVQKEVEHFSGQRAFPVVEGNMTNNYVFGQHST
ncbi:hypothetical protein ACFFRR_007784 [Megaselia abdita]